MKCIDTDILQKYLDGEVSMDEKTGVETHLATCNLCSFRLAQLQGCADRIKKLLNTQSDAEVVLPPLPSNLLYFEYPKEKDANLFHVWVYSNDGGFVCESKFVCEDYDLIINPSRMVFRSGYLYSLQNAKGAKGIPMRLVRFKLMAE